MGLTWWKIQSVLAWHALRGDRQARFRLLQAAAELLYPSYRFVDPRLDWWRDEDFNAYLQRFGEDFALNTHRRWMLWQLLRLTAGIDGDTAECGVYCGASSWLICAANVKTSRTHYAFDSF